MLEPGHLRPWCEADQFDELGEFGQVVDGLAVLNQVEADDVSLAHNLIEGVANGGFV